MPKTKAKPKKSTKKGVYTHITFLLDRSGSMGKVKGETISGFNHFLEEQKKGPGRATMTLIQFDIPPFEILYENVAIKDVRPLNEDTYQPRSMTALLEAVVQTISTTASFLQDFEATKKKKPDQVLMVIFTDGLENASREVSKASLKALVEEKTEKEKWQFVFLGANQDAFEEAGQMGIQRGHTINYAADKVGTASAMRHVSDSVSSYRESGQTQCDSLLGGSDSVEDTDGAKEARRKAESSSS